MKLRAALGGTQGSSENFTGSPKNPEEVGRTSRASEEGLADGPGFEREAPGEVAEEFEEDLEILEGIPGRFSETCGTPVETSEKRLGTYAWRSARGPGAFGGDRGTTTHTGRGGTVFAGPACSSNR